ncbi:hypothetical protein KR032_003622, partial [Drosophila birchii]
SDVSVLREEMTTTSQMEMNPNGGSTGEGLESTGEEVAMANNSANLTPGNVVAQKNVAGVVGTTSTQRALDATKRKKLKSRNGATSSPASTNETPAAVSKINRSSLSYSKDHLDAWLENCLRDATNAQLSSSSEFLDFIPPTASVHKQMFVSQQQQMQQQQQQQLQQQQQQQLQQQQLQQQQQQQVPMRSQPYGMGTGTPFSLGIQRHSRSLSHRYPMLFPPQSLNGYGMGMGMGYGGGGDGGQEFASLPPLVNMMGAGAGGPGSEHEPNSTDVLDGSGSNPNFSRGFRFSDPCLLNPSDSNDSKLSGQNTPDCRNGNASGGSGCDLAQQNKFFAALMEQINILHDTNSKICRNLHETKVDIEALKHPAAAAAAAASGQAWAGPGMGGMRHRRDSLSGLSTQSQPMVFGGGLGGTHSPAPTFHSGAYTPGMMTDVVREVKEAARVREDAMLSRVKSMVEERQWTVNEGNVRILRDIDDLKSHVMQLRLERKETNKRLSHLEAENKYLRQALAGCYNQRQASSYRDIIYENDRARGSRKPFPNGGGVQGPRRAQSFNLHYGTMHQTPTQATHSLEEDDEVEEEEQLEQAELENEVQSVVSKRLSCSSNESRSNGLHTPASTHQPQPQQAVRSPPTFALISEQVNPGLPPPLLPRKKEHAQLKRELSEAAAARKEANQRIIALEKLVKDLSAQVVASQSSGTAPAPTAASVLASKFSVADGGPFTDL